MSTWIITNLGNVFVVAILLLLVGWIVYRMIQNKKKGKHSCGGNCNGCSMGDYCKK